MQRQEQGRGRCPEVSPVFIFSVTNGIPVTAASLWDASCCLGVSHLPTASISPQPMGNYRCLKEKAAAPGEPLAAAIPQQVLAELFLGSSLLPHHRVPLSHQAELLVPPRGRRGHSGHHSLKGQAKAPPKVVPGESC